MASTPVEYDLLDLEIEYWQAVRDKSADAALRLTDEGCLMAGASGLRRLDTQSFATMAKAPYKPVALDAADSSVWVRRGGR